jgi:N-acetylated-alpha-linked acidic dipeptidase
MDLRPLISRERMDQHIKELCNYYRYSGTEPDDRAVDYVVSTLEAAKVPHKVHEFPAYISIPGPASMSTLQPARGSIECITHGMGASTPPGGMDAELVWVGEGEDSDYEGKCVKGKVAMFGGFRGLVLPDKARIAENHGATATICVTFDEVFHMLIASTVWGTPTLDNYKELPGIPVFTIQASSGQRLRNLLESGKVVLHMEASVDTQWRRLRLPVTHIGPDTDSSHFFIVGGHFDGWFEGASDNATGDAVLLELALAFTKVAAKLKRGLRIAWWPGHSHGRYAGSAWYVDNHWLELDKRCDGVMIVDSPGTLYASIPQVGGMAEVEEILMNTLKELKLPPARGAHRPGRGGDQSFLGLGITSMAMASELPQDHPDRRPVAGSGGAYWWHSSYDTVDKGDAQVCVNDAVMIGEAVSKILCADVLPYKLAATANHFREVLGVIAEKCKGQVDMSLHAGLASEVAKLAAKFDESVAKGAVVESLADETILTVGRCMNSVLYSKAGRFYQDPAARQSLMPGLAKATARLGDPCPDISGFARATAIKEGNRVLDALVRAKCVLENATK